MDQHHEPVRPQVPFDVVTVRRIEARAQAEALLGLDALAQRARLARAGGRPSDVGARRVERGRPSQPGG